MTICRKCVKRESDPNHRRCAKCIAAALTCNTCGCQKPNERSKYCQPCGTLAYQRGGETAMKARWHGITTQNDGCNCGNDACTGLTCDRAAPYNPAVTHILVVRPASPRTPYR